MEKDALLKLKAKADAYLDDMTDEEQSEFLFINHMKMLVQLTQAMGLVTCAANKKIKEWPHIEHLVRDDIIEWLEKEGDPRTMYYDSTREFRNNLAAKLVIAVRDMTEKRLGFIK